MPSISLNGHSLSDLTLRLPLYGSWVANCVHADPADVPAVGESATLALGSQVFVGTVFRVSILEDDSWDTYIVGGAGGLSTQLPPIQYVGPSVGIVLQDALSSGGESLSATTSATILGTSLKSWRRSGRTVGRELDALCVAVGSGASWRVLSDGSVWVGIDGWSSASTVEDFDTLSWSASSGCVVIGSEDPTVLPGQIWVAGDSSPIKIGDVVHHVRADDSRTEIFFASPGDRDVGTFDKLLPAPDLLSFYQYKVLSQNADNTLELRSLDARLPDISSCPVRFGIPGTIATIPVGHIVLVGFSGGVESDPYAAAWVSGTATNLSMSVSSLLELGSSPATSFVALSTLTDARITALQQKLDSLIAKYDAHVHPGVTVGAGVTAITATPEAVLGPQATVAATKVKAT